MVNLNVCGQRVGAAVVTGSTPRGPLPRGATAVGGKALERLLRDLKVGAG